MVKLNEFIYLDNGPYTIAKIEMLKINSFEFLLVRKITFLVVTMTLALAILSMQNFILNNNSSQDALSMALFKDAYADHGQEITLTLYNSSFGSLSSGSGNQVGVFASYELNDDSIKGQTINAVMEVYAPNGTLIRTSSYPNGFVAQSSGGVEGLETTIRDPTLQSVIANVTFRNLDKTTMLSNDLRVDLNLAEESAAPTTSTGEDIGSEVDSPGLDSELEQTPDLVQPTDEEESGVNDEDEVGTSEQDTEDEEQDEGQELPLPLFG